MPRDGRYTDRYIKSVPFYFYLDVMSAVMVKIDRLTICFFECSEFVNLCYDMLILYLIYLAYLIVKNCFVKCL